jgi:hypothetical protein
MVTVLGRSEDWSELDIRRQHLEALGYAVALESDSTCPSPGFVMLPEVYRLVALSADQAEVIVHADSQGIDVPECPQELRIDQSALSSSDMNGALISILRGLFSRK